MQKLDIEYYIDYFGKEPTININIKDAEICIDLLTENILDSHTTIRTLKEHINALDNIKNSIKELQNDIDKIKIEYE